MRRQASGRQFVPIQPLDAVFDAWSLPRERNDVTDGLASLEDICEGEASYRRVPKETHYDASEGQTLNLCVIRSFE